MFRGGGVAWIDWLPTQASEISGVCSFESLELLGRIGSVGRWLQEKRCRLKRIAIHRGGANERGGEAMSAAVAVGI